MTSQPIILWYRNDLRVHDHEPLYRAIETHAPIVPIYCFDPRQFSKTAYGFPKTGPFRAQFLLESVANLRQSLQNLGSNLIIKIGKPESILPQIAQQVNAWAIYFHQEVTAEEIAVETALSQAVKSLNIDIKSFWGHTLYHCDRLPFDIPNIPELFTHFRKQVEKKPHRIPAFPPLPSCHRYRK